MKTIETIMRAGAIALVIASGGHAFAANCHDLVAGGTYACLSDPDDELPEFTLAFDAQGKTVTSPQLLVSLACFCSSTGGVKKPNIEGGRIIACATADENSAVTITARAQGDALVQGTLGGLAAGGRELFPFFCKRAP